MKEVKCDLNCSYKCSREDICDLTDDQRVDCCPSDTMRRKLKLPTFNGG